mgnify:CR=1 FL=1
MRRILFNFLLAIEQVNTNKLRSVLTALGIVFGVGAVIAMLAIGAGARQSILDQMKLIGTNNIVISSATAGELTAQEGEDSADSDDSGTDGQNDDRKPYSPGLTLADLQAVENAIQDVELISPEIVVPTTVIRAGQLVKARTVGVTNAFFELNQLTIGQGKPFHDIHLERGMPVCVIGKDIQTRFFSNESPIGQKIKCGNTWLTVIGVLEGRTIRRENRENLGIRDYNSDVYIPISSALLRFQDRATFAQNRLQRRRRGRDDDENYHQLDRVVVRLADAEKLKVSADLIARLLKRRHYGLVDFQIEVPELLLEQQQKTQETFNLVLAAIAAISLLVGGIGIMNIMLASVLERIKEVGIRRSLGATEKDIVQQFLFEAVFISLIGGLIGVVLGVLGARIIAGYADIPTIVSAWSVILSFGVASAIGLIFGIVPARRAARQDPIQALRN